MPNIGLPPLVHVSTVTFQFSSVSWLDKWSGESSSRLLCRRPLWTFLAWAGMSTLWCYPFRIFSATQGALKVGFGESVAAVWHFRTMRVSVYWRLPEDVPVVPQRSWSCSTPGHWSCAQSRRYRKVSSYAWFQKSKSFFDSQQAGPLFHSRRGGWRWQETCQETSQDTWPILHTSSIYLARMVSHQKVIPVALWLMEMCGHY